jgi:hypothetical protein
LQGYQSQRKGFELVVPEPGSHEYGSKWYDFLYLYIDRFEMEKKNIANNSIETSEHVHLLAALNYYSRMRFITNLIPLLQASPTLSRIVVVPGGGMEGRLDPADFPALRVPLPQLRGHLSSLITLGLEHVAKRHPRSVSCMAIPEA